MQPVTKISINILQTQRLLIRNITVATYFGSYYAVQGCIKIECANSNMCRVTEGDLSFQ